MSSRFEGRKVTVDRYPVPPTAEEISALIQKVMSSGDTIQKVELLTADQLIRVTKIVPDDGMSEGDISWEAALRNVDEMIEYLSEGASSFQITFDMMQLVSSKGLNPTMWITGASEQELSKWLELKWRGMPNDVSGLLGLPIQYTGSLPAESLILCGSRYQTPDASEVVFAVRTAMEGRRDHEEVGRHGETDDPIRSSARERNPTTADVGVFGQLRRIQWRDGEDVPKDVENP